jgi:hypothetical protein
MLVSPFTYYRGAALPMAADLADARSVNAMAPWATHPPMM